MKIIINISSPKKIASNPINYLMYDITTVTGEGFLHIALIYF